jgi:hypothetical protein
MAALFYCLGLLLVGGALVGVLSGDAPWMDSMEVRQEIVKIGLQVIVFGVVGGGVKLLLDRRAEYRAFRTDMLERLGKAHRDVYRIRRLLGVTGTDTASLLGELMNARQDLGAAYHFARSWGFRRKLAQIRRETDCMRSYLKRVIEGALARDDAPERIVYTDFLDWRVEHSAYNSEFKKHYSDAKQLIDPSFRPNKPDTR